MMIVYIAGPFGGTPEEQQANTERAEALASYAVRQGCSPICVHSGILRGVYGDDNAPADRRRGLNAVLRLVEVCEEVWAITRDDGSLSPGMHAEKARLDAANPRRWVQLRWDEWEENGATI